MSAIHHKLKIEAPGEPPVQSQGASSPGQGMPSSGSIDPLVLAFFFLLEASNTSDQSALLHAKQLGQNAAAQQKLNAEIEGLQRDTVPTLQNKYRTTYICHYYFFFWWFTKETTHTVIGHPNQQAVSQAQMDNQEMSVQRQMLTAKIADLQQNAQVTESEVNSITDEAMQTTQEGTGLLQMLQNLTYQALLRHAPQG
jgi:hypothetical protein